MYDRGVIFLPRPLDRFHARPEPHFVVDPQDILRLYVTDLRKSWYRPLLQGIRVVEVKAFLSENCANTSDLSCPLDATEVHLSANGEIL